MNDLARVTIAFVQDHEAWAAPLLFALAFGESFAFIAVWTPFVSILLAVGAVLGASGVPFWPAWLGAILGAFAAQWLAYEMAFRLKGRVMRFWPLSRNEALVARGVAFFRQRGLPAVVVGRFFGPLRAVTPFAAGLCEMPRVRFQVANAMRTESCSLPPVPMMMVSVAPVPRPVIVPVVVMVVAAMVPILHLLQVLARAGGCADHGAIGRRR